MNFSLFLEWKFQSTPYVSAFSSADPRGYARGGGPRRSGDGGGGTARARLRGSGLARALPAGGGPSGPGRVNEWIFGLNLSINFGKNYFTEFSDYSPKILNFSEILNQFELFKVCSRNSNKLSPRFRRGIVFFQLKTFDWIFNIQFRKDFDEFSCF